ncbi:MAG: NCS2 family permease, partial [Myxococcota bacterium]
TPLHRAAAVGMGLLPGVAAWGAIRVKAGARAAVGTFGPELGDALTKADVHADGLFALEQGFIFTAMLLSAATVDVIEGRFRRAAAWMAAGAVLSALGLIHAWGWGVGDTVLVLKPGVATDAALGYAAGALVLFLAPWLGERTAVRHE